VYDSYVEAYERFLCGRGAVALAEVQEMVRYLLPQGEHTVVDLCCGPGMVSGALIIGGWHVIGVDASRSMVTRARGRLSHVVNRPVQDTGLPAGAYSVVMSTLSHTDAPWEAIVAEAHRLLEPGGYFVYVGTHPCFLGPHAQRGQLGGLVMYPGLYGDSTRLLDAPGYSPDGIRRTVGASHLSLAALLDPLHDPALWERPVLIEGEDLAQHIGVRVCRR
jgi:SAM-dependent methyltransferase